MSKSAPSILVYVLVGWVILVFVGTALSVLFLKRNQQRQETPEGRARREKINAWQARRNQTMAIRLAGSSWGFALGVLVSTLVRRRLPEETRQLVPPFEAGPNKPLQPPRASEPNGQREPSGNGPRG